MIKPIKTEKDFNLALKRIETLWNATDGTKQGDEVDILVTLVAAYEEEHHPMPPPTSIEAIKFRMEQRGLTRTDLARMLGSKSRASEILSGKRKLTIRTMKVLHRELGVPAESLLGD